MPRGGARVNSGPPPDPNALRRDRKQDKQGWTLLPAEGRQGEPPPWPLKPFAVNPEDVDGAAWVMEQSERELELWRELWATPQAAAWQKLKFNFELAMYVRVQVKAERTGDTKALAEARMWSDRFGLNQAAMLRLRWKIVEDELATRRAERSGPRSSGGSSMRERVRKVNGGA